MSKYYTNERSQQILISLLKSHGIRKVIASPGTTNMTLIGSMQQDPYFQVYSSVDERSAAYLACGMAAESEEPVVLSCTGATASRNYMPGLTEAFYRKLPIIAITATQGHTKVGHHIAQVIDRAALPNDIVKLSVDIPVIKDCEEEWSNTVKINRALLEVKRHGGGPIHINLATSYSRDFSVVELPPVRIINRITPNSKFPVLNNGRIAVCVGSHSKWTLELEKSLDNFCATNNAVVFCDHTSGYKGKYRILFSLVANQEKYRSELLSVDTLIHIGEISGDYSFYGIQSSEVWRVNEDGELRDTFKKLRFVFEMTEQSFFEYYSQKGSEKREELLQEYKREYSKVLEKMPELPFSNIWIASIMSSKLPENSILHLGILNSLRSWNLFEIPNSVLSYSNVGGFGIDGIVSSLVGASLINKDKLYFGVLGDLALFYDMNVLGNHQITNNLRILLINNGCGTEFKNYGHPGNEFGNDADKYIAAAGHFGNKSPRLIKHYVEELGFEYISASSKQEFEAVYERFLCTVLTSKPLLFEVFTDSSDESEALELTRNYMINSKTICIKKIKSIGRKLLRR